MVVERFVLLSDLGKDYIKIKIDNADISNYKPCKKHGR